MGLPTGREVRYRRTLRLVGGLGLFLVGAPYLTGQATPAFPDWKPAQSAPVVSPGGNMWPNQSSRSTYNSSLTQPNPYSRPTREQVEQYVNSSQELRTLDAVTKSNIVNGATLGFLSSPYLPNGSQNPFYNKGPNWYVPSTWSSSQMNWQGVQTNGFLPNGSATGYNSTYGRTTYNPSTYYRPPPIPNQTSRANGYTGTSTTNPVRMGEPPGVASFKATAPIVNLSGNPNSRSMARLEGARALHESGGDKVAEALDHSERARLLLQRDKPELALAEISAAEEAALLGNDKRLQADLFQTKAAALMSSGEFEQAVTAYREAMTRLRSQGDEPDQAEIYVSAGWAFQSLGKIQDAMAAYGSGLTLFRRYKDTEGEARTLIAMGSLYREMGDFPKTADLFMSAAQISSDDQFVQILVSAGEMFESRDMHLKAIDCYLRAAAYIKEKKGDPKLMGAIDAGLGRSHMALWEFDRSRADFKRAESEMSGSGDRIGEAGVTASIAELDYYSTTWQTFHGQGYANALKGYTKALALMREEDDRTGEIGVLTDMGSLFEAKGKFGEAVDYYGQALDELEELRTSARLDEFRTDLSSQSENLYGRVMELDVRQHRMEEAFNLSERARARTSLDLLGNTKSSHSGATPESFVSREDTLRKQNIVLQRQLAQEMAKPMPDVDEARTQAIRTQLGVVRGEYRRALDEIKLSSPRYASLLSVAPLTLREAQRQLDPDTTILSYFTLPDRTLAFVVTRDSFHVTELHITEQDLNSVLSTLLDFAGASETPPELRSLYKSLVAPLKSQLTTRRLAIVPYGALHKLPFAALTPDGKQFLGDEYSMTMLPSVSAWPYLRGRGQPGAGGALVLAADRVEGLPGLDQGRDEAETVASIFGSKPLFGREASVAALRSHGGEFGILHLMGHVDQDTKDPELSRFVLGDDGNAERNLDVHEILSLDLHKTDLIVLSGCQSQKGKQSRGDDATALSSAFMYAGAPSVVASLWNVDDDATKQLMVAFYTHLREGLSKAEALQAAQKEVRSRLPHPYYWASFVLIGDPGSSGGVDLMAKAKP